MARAQFLFVVANDRGDVYTNAALAVVEHGTSTPVTDAFPSESGGVPQSGYISQTQGYVEFWLETDRTVDAVITDNGGRAYYPFDGPSIPRSFDEFRVTLGAHATQGPRGVTGPTGATGAQGSTVTGPTGATGLPGPSGPSGTAGVAGPAGTAGPTGPAGGPGAPGATGPIGPTGAFRWEGPYQTGDVYEPNDAVQWNGSTWVAVAAGQLAHPPDTATGTAADWQLVAAEGVTGPQGMQGVTGTGGTAGAVGPTGPVGMDWEDTYATGTAYSVDDVVEWHGSSFIARNAGTLPAPPEAAPPLVTVTGPTGPPGTISITRFFDATRDYGGNGQAAIDAAEAAGGGVVWLGAVLYDGPLVVPSFVHLQGPGHGVTTVRLPNGSPIGTHTISTKNADTAQQHTFSIIGLTVDGNKANNPNGGDAVHVFGSNHHLDDLLCERAHGHGLYLSGQGQFEQEASGPESVMGWIDCRNNDGDGIRIDGASDMMVPGPLYVEINGGNGLTVNRGGINFGQIHTSINKKWGCEILANGQFATFDLLETDGDNALDAGHPNTGFLGGGLHVAPGAVNIQINQFEEITSWFAQRATMLIEDRTYIGQINIEYMANSPASPTGHTPNPVNAIELAVGTSGQPFLRAGICRLHGNGSAGTGILVNGSQMLRVAELDIEDFSGVGGFGIRNTSNFFSSVLRGRIFNCDTLIDFGSTTASLISVFDLQLAPANAQTAVVGSKPDLGSCQVRIYSKNTTDASLVLASWDRMVPTNFPVGAVGVQVVNFTHHLIWPPTIAEIKAILGLSTGNALGAVSLDPPIVQITGATTVQFLVNVRVAGTAGQMMQLAAELGAVV